MVIYSEHSGVSRRAKLPGRSVEVKKFVRKDGNIFGTLGCLQKSEAAGKECRGKEVLKGK